MKQRSVAFIIIAYKPEPKEFGVLLTSLEGNPVIIIDNGNTLTQDDVGRATLLSQTTNIGYGAAANIGIRHASGLRARWFVILNQDMRLDRQTVLYFIRMLKVQLPGIAGPFPGGLDTKRWTSVLPSYRMDYVTGSCLAIHEKVVSKVGYFYEPYFLYYEDADYCVRASQSGVTLAHIPLPEAAHDESLSLGRGSRLHQYYLARNHMLLVSRLAPSRVRLYETVRFPKTIAEHILRGENGALAGIRDFLLRRFGAYRKRGV